MVKSEPKKKSQPGGFFQKFFRKPERNEKEQRLTVQRSIPYLEMGRDGICRVEEHTVLEDFYAVGTLADELTDGFHMEAHGYLDREEVNARLIAFARKLEQVLDKWETHAALIA